MHIVLMHIHMCRSFCIWEQKVNPFYAYIHVYACTCTYTQMNIHSYIISSFLYSQKCTGIHVHTLKYTHSYTHVWREVYMCMSGSTCLWLGLSNVHLYYWCRKLFYNVRWIMVKANKPTCHANDQWSRFDLYKVLLVRFHCLILVFVDKGVGNGFFAHKKQVKWPQNSMIASIYNWSICL